MMLYFLNRVMGTLFLLFFFNMSQIIPNEKEISNKKDKVMDFSCGLVVNNPPANARDTGLITGLGRFHITWGSSAPVPQLLSPHTTTTESLHALEPVLWNKRSHWNERPEHQNQE